MPAAIADPEVRRRRPFGLYLLVWCLSLITMSGGAYFTIIDQTIGSLPLLKRLHWEGYETAVTRAAILHSAQSAVRSGDHPEYYYDLSAYWEHLLHAQEIPFETITDEQLAGGIGQRVNVLILPWAVCLSDEQRAAVRQFVAAGNGLVATGAPGARNADCSWNGWEFMSELTGLHTIESFAPPAGTFAAYRGRQYFSAAVPPGLLVELGEHEMTVGITEEPDVYWSDRRWKPWEGAAPGEVALGTHHAYGEGRVAWFGYNERLMANREQKALDQLALSAVWWVAREPLIAVAEWPDRKESAVLLAGELGAHQESASLAARMLHDAGVPGTLFVNALGVPSDTFDAEIALAGDPNLPLTSQNVLGQANQLQSLRESLGPRLAAGVLPGLKPALDQWNLDTIVSLRSARYGYFLDRSQSRTASPQIIDFPSATWFGERVEVARIGAAWADDMEVIANYTGPTPWTEDVAGGYLEAFQRSRLLYGLYTLSFGATFLGAPENLHIVRAAIDRMKSEPVWFASGAEITQWWSRRQKVRVEARRVNENRIRVAVTNRGLHNVKNLDVLLHLPFRPKKVRLIPEIVSRSLPDFELLPDADILDLRFTEMDKQSSRVFLVVLDET